MKESKVSKHVFNQMIKDNKALVLTLDRAKKLKGKTIIWSYFGYEGNEQFVYEMTVGNIVSSWDYNKTQPMKAYKSRTEYWQNYMTPEQIQREKDEFILLDEKDLDNNYIYCNTGNDSCFDVPTFHCSDADRCVFFREHNVKTLSQLADYINSSEDYPSDVELICELNHWLICDEDWDIAIDPVSNEILSFTDQKNKVEVFPYNP